MTDHGMRPFAGWPPEAFEWFRELEVDNSRAWFQAHRSTYDDAVRGPLESLLAEVADEFGDGKVTRPNRDTRFSPDKSPYKLQIYATVPCEGGSWYVQLRDEGLFAGGGLYAPERAQLASLRAAIADDKSGVQLESILAGLRARHLELVVDGELKTAPRGFAVDHPRIALLRLRHLAAGTQYRPASWLHTARAKDRVVDTWRALRPLLDWCATYAS